MGVLLTHVVHLCELENGTSSSKHFITIFQKIVIINTNIYDIHNVIDILQNHVYNLPVCIW